MSLFGIWPFFGFVRNPYNQDALTPDEIGDFLLVGRDDVVSDLQMRLGSGGVQPSVEGPIGVGKSSLIAVTSYRMARHCLQERAGELYLPADAFFQASDRIDELEAEVYRVVAQTLISNRDSFVVAGLPEPNIDDLEQWLNQANYSFTSGGATFAGTGATVAHGSEPNTAEGFRQSGFAALVRGELDRCFPTEESGAIICVLDNLELLNQTSLARDVLDQLRDRVFTNPHLRWVLCGSRGLVSRARSQRLSGVFQRPLIIAPLDTEATVELVARRIERFGKDGAAVPPVTPTGFRHIYDVLNLNLRDALARAQDFAHWLYRQYLAKGRALPDQDELDQLMRSWLLDQAKAAYSAAGGVQQRAWRLFDEIAARGGRAGSAEYESFDFINQQQMSNAVTQLVDVNLVVRERDPDDATRTINAITAEGWLVSHFRSVEASDAET